ncbi:MAG: ScpA family protein [Pseudomonadota bacterium]
MQEQGSTPNSTNDDWDNDADTRASVDPQLKVDVDGFEGPLDLLLELGRRQKVDLAKISILALAEQYLEFIENVRKLRIELAADYLVMAAWLAFLKSKLLVPSVETQDDELSGEEMAAILAFRLKRLDAMREAGKRLINRNRLGRDFFARGNPEPIEIDRKRRFDANLYDLLSAYAEQRQRTVITSVNIGKRAVWSLQEARDMLVAMIGDFGDWTSLDKFLLPYISTPKLRNTATASSFAASLELAREGKLKLRQEEAFAPLYLKGVTEKPIKAMETRSQ